MPEDDYVNSLVDRRVVRRMNRLRGIPGNEEEPVTSDEPGYVAPIRSPIGTKLSPSPFIGPGTRSPIPAGLTKKNL